MPNLTCVPCQRRYEIECQEIVLIVMAYDPPVEYALYQADRWMCPNCQHMVIAGRADFPFARIHEPDFADHLRRARENGPTIVYQYERNHGAVSYELERPSALSRSRLF